MTGVVRVQLAKHNGKAATRHTPAPPPKRKKTTINDLRDLANPEQSSNIEIEMLSLRRRLGSGTTKKLKTMTGSGERLTVVDDTSTFPVDVEEFMYALHHSVCAINLSDKASLCPTRLNEKHLSVCFPVVTEGSVTRMLKYNVPWTLLNKLNVALDNAQRRDRIVSGAISSSLSRTNGIETIDLCSSSESATGYAVAVAPGLKAFSARHLSTLNSLHKVSNLQELYAADVFWLRKDLPGVYPGIPYLQTTLETRADIPSDDFMGARAAARDVLQTCTLSTTFSLKTSQRELVCLITTQEIVGYLARDAELNDSVMTYALRQMASDYMDVHVFDCHLTDFSTPRR